MIEELEKNQIVSVPVTLSENEYMRQTFCCPNRKQVFSPQKLYFLKNIKKYFVIQTENGYFLLKKYEIKIK